MTRGRDASATSSPSRPLVAELDAIQRALLFAARHRCQPAHRPCQLRPRRGDGRRGADARRGRVDRDLPALPVLHRGGRRAARRRRQVRAAAAHRPPSRDALWDEVARGHVDIVASDHSPHRARDEAGRFHGGVGRHCGRAVHARRPARSRSPWARPAADAHCRASFRGRRRAASGSRTGDRWRSGTWRTSS